MTKHIASPTNGQRRALGFTALVTAAVAAHAAAADAPAPKPDTAWKTSAALGASLTRGNSDTLTVNGTIDTLKKWDKNELGAGASVTYGETDDKTTANNIGAYGQYNRLFTDQLFGYARLDFLKDELADLDYRFSLSPGLGYYFLKDDKFTLAGEVGPGYVWEKLGGASDEYATLHLGERFTWEVNERARLWQSLGYDPQVDDFNNYLLTAEIGFETDIVTNLSLRVVALDKFRNQPAPGRTQNDLQLITGIAYKF